MRPVVIIPKTGPKRKSLSSNVYDNSSTSPTRSPKESPTFLAAKPKLKRQSVLVPATEPSHGRSATPASLPSDSTKHTKTTTNTHTFYNDRLGTLVQGLCKDYLESGSWEEFVNNFRGRSYLSPDLEKVDHPAIDLLKLWRDEGVPAETTSETWSRDQLDKCIQRGCHRSAKEHSKFLREEMSEFIENKFWVVLPYELAQELPSLQLSPSAVKDERDRNPDSSVTTHGTGAGPPSTTPPCITPHQKRCSLVKPFLASSTM